MLYSIKYTYASRIVSKENSLLLKGATSSIGELTAEFCSFSGALISVGVIHRHWAAIRSFTVLYRQKVSRAEYFASLALSELFTIASA